MGERWDAGDATLAAAGTWSAAGGAGEGGTALRRIGSAAAAVYSSRQGGGVSAAATRFGNMVGSSRAGFGTALAGPRRAAEAERGFRGRRKKRDGGCVGGAYDSRRTASPSPFEGLNMLFKESGAEFTRVARNAPLRAPNSPLSAVRVPSHVHGLLSGS